jgi:8-oxo-dGTP pyrophosphatase MutT (NUDIX family)
VANDSLTKLPSPYYRVTTRAIIFDERFRLLVIENDDGKYELPGGGWGHKESFEECLRREIKEELGVKAMYIGNVWFQYRGKRKNRPWFLRLCAPVQINSFDFKMGEGMKRAIFVNRQTFLNVPFASDEAPIKEHVDKMWPPVEKNAEKR